MALPDSVTVLGKAFHNCDQIVVTYKGISYAVFPASVIAGMTGNRSAEFLRDEKIEAKKEIRLR